MNHFLELPKEVFELVKSLEKIKQEKNEVVRSQKYEEAVKLRNLEKQLCKSIEKAIVAANPLADGSEILMSDYWDMIMRVQPGDSDFSNAIDRLDKNKKVGYDIVTTCLQLFNKEANFDETAKKMAKSVLDIREEVKKQLLQAAMKKLFE